MIYISAGEKCSHGLHSLNPLALRSRFLQLITIVPAVILSLTLEFYTIYWVTQDMLMSSLEHLIDKPEMKLMITSVPSTSHLTRASSGLEPET